MSSSRDMGAAGMTDHHCPKPISLQNRPDNKRELIFFAICFVGETSDSTKTFARTVSTLCWDLRLF